MNAAIRKVTLVIMLLFLVIFVQLNYLQVVTADDLASNPYNRRDLLRDMASERGDIYTADGELVAISEETDDELEWIRKYPFAEMFAQISGYWSYQYFAEGLERSYNDELTGRTPELEFRDLSEILMDTRQLGTLRLTIDSKAQRAAINALGGLEGSVVAMDPQTGAILAMYSNPTYDPNLLAVHDRDTLDANYHRLIDDPQKPTVAHSYREIFAPGSTFKVITAASAIEMGYATPDSNYPVLTALDLPLTNLTLKNYGGSSCGGTLTESFKRSCNTSFGEIALDMGDDFAKALDNWGVDQAPPIDLLPGAATGTAPQVGNFSQQKPQFAYAGIGQGDVSVTPLYMCMVAATIANEGKMMTPHVVDQVLDSDGKVVERITPKVWREPISPDTAGQVKDMMIAVVNEGGTGTRAAIDGVVVAGKTGTAQVNGQDPGAWFVAFAPADNPTVAIAVHVEDGGNVGGNASGGVVAAPIARQVLEAIL
ncbi:MAG: penicillin-binding protein 2 [Acidimicrobiia bacterium]|nr:penicillin-binding protein 2 [Acidimicrobiia bacterium]